MPDDERARRSIHAERIYTAARSREAAGRRRRPRRWPDGKKKVSAACSTLLLQRTTLREGEKMDLGLEDAAPRSKIDAPRGSAAATRVAAPDLHNLEL